MIPPLNIFLEICNRLFRRREHAGTFFSIKMPVIALSGLVIISQNALAAYHVRKPVLEIM